MTKIITCILHTFYSKEEENSAEVENVDTYDYYQEFQFESESNSRRGTLIEGFVIEDQD